MAKHWHASGYYTGPLDFFGDVPWKFQRKKRVRAIGPHDERPEGLSRELATALVRDFSDYPSLRTLCSSYQVEYEAACGWILSGTSPSGSELEAWFSSCMAASEADAARDLYEEFKKHARMGSKSTVDFYKVLTERFQHIRQDPDISTLIQTKSDKGDRRKGLLKNPPPALLAELHAAGWRRE